MKLPVLVGDFNPGYIYEAKIHKDTNNPVLRPIIWQIPSPTYEMTKFLNSVIEPFLTAKYVIKITDELLYLRNVTQTWGMLASLDVESLFTNVPIDDTIRIIVHSVYEHPTMPPPRFPKETLKKLLEICTKESRFKHIHGSINKQTDVVALESLLGCIFANY